MRGLSVVLSCLISMPLAPLAEAQAGPKLSLVVVEGEGAIHNVRQRTVRPPAVQVEDENHQPIAGAAVLFTLPDQGVGGAFAGGAHTLTVMSDQAGRAVARGFRPNSIEGEYPIHVSASYRNQTADAVISQSNVLPAGAAAAGGGRTGRLIAVLAVGVAAMVGGVYATTRSGQASPVNTSTTIAAGTAAVGAPR
jgi:hypothetical protein